ncbi:MAG: cytochrome b N-terminal domain-containing protein, partial [Gemmatimonadota bacterium]
VFIWGAYKRPRELTWLTGIVLLLITAGLVFTGAPLPWDERGYWAAEVGTSIAGTVPLVGDVVKNLLRGGERMGQLALSRMFILHVGILPAAILGIVAVHLVAFRTFGSVGPWNEAERRRTGPFWPDQVAKDLVVAAAVLLLLVALSVYAPAPIAGPADPLDTSYVPKPEWNFLFLYEALKFFPGALEPVATVGIPLVGLALLASLPFFDRREERSPRRRPAALLAGTAWVAGVLAITVAGYRSHSEGTSPGAAPAPTGAPSTLSASARGGEALFASLGCGGCHSVNGAGGAVGPDLTNEARRGRSRQWLIDQIRDPKAHNPQTIMPGFPSLSRADADHLVDYLMSLGADASPNTASPDPARPARAPADPPPAPRPAPVAQGPPGPAAAIIGSAEHGGLLFARYCAQCHGRAGAGNVADPDSALGTFPALAPIAPSIYSTDAEAFATNVDRFLQHGAVMHGPRPGKNMHAFGDRKSLTQEQIADIEAYVLQLNGIDRAQLNHPGIAPADYFLLSVVLSAIAVLVIGGAWWRMRAARN